MPDNPRTLAELDALYADNNAGAISAQDLRDGFHSVASPIMGGGLDVLRPSSRAPECNATWNLYDGAGLQTLPSGFAAGIPNVPTPDGKYDPSGRFPASAYVSSYLGKTFPANSWAELPEGVWQLSIISEWTPGDYYRFLAWILLDDPVGVDGYLENSFEPTEFSPETIITSGNATVSTSSCLVVPSGQTYRVGLRPAHLAGSDKQLFYLQASIQLIGG